MKTVTETGESALKQVVWAGLGAYSKGIEQVGMAQHLVTKRFTSLVEQGQHVETETLSRVKHTKAAMLARTETQLNDALRKTCGVDRNRLSSVEAKIDQLQLAVDKLVKQAAE
ncbi:hypothetical protein VV869_07295 [Photobacterium sp. MCCC 1A19761]|uniref:phasin-related domain-containing protein n=1 Tax=Photobacterium sp. MCCC 1A19761 TaxID=3115000 RepID=UPI00307F09AB